MVTCLCFPSSPGCVFMTGLEFFSLACWYEEGGSQHAIPSPPTPHPSLTSPSYVPNCVQMEQYISGYCQESFAINAPKASSVFLTKYRIHCDSTLNQPQHWKVEGKGRNGGVTASFKYAFSCLSYNWTLQIFFFFSFPKRNYPCMRWSTKWKSPWDRTLNTVNGTKRQAESSRPEFLLLLEVIQNISAMATLLETQEHFQWGDSPLLQSN